MGSTLQKSQTGFANKAGSPEGRVKKASGPEQQEEAALSHVIEEVQTLFHALPECVGESHRINLSGRLIGAVVLAFVDGDLKRGDPFPCPVELARVCHMPLIEVLDAIAFLMQHRLLQQDATGDLHISPYAVPTCDMKHQALLHRTRQLVRQAHEWHVSNDGLRSLFERATRETA